MPQSGLAWEFEIPTWEKTYKLLLNLANQIKKAGFEPDMIIGVARGGWLPALILSDLLEAPYLATVRVEFYLSIAEPKGEPVITQPVSVQVKGKKVLIVDDLADTGKSLVLVRDHLKEKGATAIKIATIYYKPWSTLTPDWFEKKTRRWVIFPWELKETVRHILENCKKHGKAKDEAKDMLINCGLDRRLVEKFIKEISEEKM